MTDPEKKPENTNESLGPLHRVMLDEPLNMWVSSGEPDDTFCVVGSSEPSRLALEGLIALGSSWRGAWDELENGEFHACPRGPDGFYTHDYQATEERTKPGEDR